MPYQKGELKGQLTTAEIRKLISAHNKLSKITIPPSSTRDTIIKIIWKAGFRVNHDQQKLEQTKLGKATKKDISLDKAKVVTKRLPKTEEQKKKATERQQEKQVQKEKEVKLAKKEGVKEFKQKKAEAQSTSRPKKSSTMGTQTDEEKKTEKENKPPVLQLGDKGPAKKEFGTKKVLRKRLGDDFKDKYGITIYRALEIPNNSDPSPSDVKTKCRKLQLKHHPDKGGDEEKFKLIQEACDIMVKTFTEDGKDEVGVSPELTRTQMEAISKYIKTYSASAIKKLSTRAEVESSFDKGQDLYIEIKQRFVKVDGGFGFKKTGEMIIWFNENMPGRVYKTFVDTEKLMKRHMTAQLKKVTGNDKDVGEAVKKPDIKSQIREELIKIKNKYGIVGSQKENKYTTERNNPISNGRVVLSKVGDRYKIITAIKTEELLLDFYNEEIKKIPVLNNNLILSTSVYDNGKKIKAFLVNKK
jgi:curved DNA-binding protein CbpA